VAEGTEAARIFEDDDSADATRTTIHGADLRHRRVDHPGYPGLRMVWRIVVIVGGLIGATLIGAAVLAHPVGESQDSGHWYLLAGGLGVLTVTAPVAWLVSEASRPIRDLRSLKRAVITTIGCALAALLGVATVAVGEDRSTVSNCFQVSSSPVRIACSRAVDYTSADSRAFIPLVLAAAVLLTTGFVVAASQASDPAEPSSGSLQLPSAPRGGA
jgi:hypothetical protein